MLISIHSNSRRITLILLAVFSISVWSQDFGLSFTNTLSKVDKQYTLIKSGFNKQTIDINGEEAVGGSYSNSYIYFFRDYIGIYLENSEIHEQPILLTEIKLISNDLNDKKLLFTCKEQAFITVDYDRSNIIWNYATQIGSMKYEFENLSWGSSSEIERFRSLFGFGNYLPSDYSKRISWNQIGWPIEGVKHSFSRDYYPPQTVQIGNDELAKENDIVLLFRAKEYDDIQELVVFNEHMVCKKLIRILHFDYLDSVREILNTALGENSNEPYHWIERVNGNHYYYFIDIFSFWDEDNFGLIIKEEF